MVHHYDAGSAPMEFGETDPKAALEAAIRERTVMLANYAPDTNYCRGAVFTTDTELADFGEMDIFTARSGNGDLQAIKLSLSYVDDQRRDRKVVAKLGQVDGIWHPMLDGGIANDTLLRIIPEDMPPALKDAFSFIHAAGSTERSAIETGHVVDLWRGIEDVLDREGVTTVYDYEYETKSGEGRVVVNAIGALPRPDGTYPPEERLGHTRCAVRMAGVFDYCRSTNWQRSTDTDQELVCRHIVSESFVSVEDRSSVKVTPERLEMVLGVMDGVLAEAQAKTASPPAAIRG